MEVSLRIPHFILLSLFLLFSLFEFLPVPGAELKSVPTWRVEDVRAGMKGQGKTVI